MVTKSDALSAAKTAALLELLPHSSNSISSVPTNSKQKSRQQTTRPRRRKKAPRVRRPRPLTSPETPDSSHSIEYEPEPVASLPLASQQQHDQPNHNLASQPLAELIDSMNRFVQRTIIPNPPENEQTHPLSDKQIPDYSTKHQPTTSVYNASDAQHKQHETNLQDDANQIVSRKKQKENRRYQISQLKSLTEQPEVVEAWDVTASDPFLLVHLKTWPNSVPVPPNWRQKRKYLQNKRGMEKKAFQLPAYIVDTGVGEMRSAQMEADEKKTLKQRQREKMRAKTGRGVEIDHARLRDAFFKYQTKPNLTKHGDIYYELRELEVDGSRFRPGTMSEELLAALGISDRDPPPWLVNMQRYGVPPGYPGLKVPGVNVPIPHGSRFGYQAGGWGKPPVDEYGIPVYGDVFGEGLEFNAHDSRFELNDTEKKKKWGEIRKPGSEVTVAVGIDEQSDADNTGDEKEASTEQQGENKNEAQGPHTQQRSGLSTTRDGHADDQLKEVRAGLKPGSLYRVLDQKKSVVGEKAMMGSSHVYDMGNAPSKKKDKVNEKRRQNDDKREGPAKRSKLNL